MRKIRYFLRFGILVAMMELPAFAGNVTLGWNANTNPVVAGYDVFFGVEGDVSTNKVTAGNVTSVTLSNLVAGTTYLFAAATYDVFGLESPLSAEVSYTVPVNVLNQLPTLNPISNLVIIQSPVTGPPVPPPPPGPPAPQTVVLSGITSSTGNQTQTITIAASSSNPALIPNPSVHYTSPSTTGTLTFTPAPNATGTATITVVVNDGRTSTNTFTVAIVPTGTIWPSFTSQLTNKLVMAGQSVNFGITAAGTGPLTYQWQFNGVNLASATNAALTLSNVIPNQTGAYSVMVSNIAGSTNSNPATLTVYATAAANLTPATPGNGQFGLTVAGVPGYPYVVQASTNLVNWVSLQTNTAPFTFMDTNAGKFSRRFYRAIYNP